MASDNLPAVIDHGDELELAGLDDSEDEHARKQLEKAQRKEGRAAAKQGRSVARRETYDARREAIKNRPVNKGGVPHATYAGGFPGQHKKASGNFVWNVDGIGIGTTKPSKARVSWDEIEAVSTDAEQIGKRKTGAVLAFGVLGGLGGRATKERAELAVILKDGSTGYFEIMNISQAQLRGKISQAFVTRGIRFTDQLAVTSAPPPSPTGGGASMADELVKLAGLHQAGMLSDEEFEAAKARLLAS